MMFLNISKGVYMIKLIEEKHKVLIELCEKYKVRRLELFGSAFSNDKFDTGQSDLDFLVEFKQLQQGEYADTYFGLLEALEQLFDRNVDLVMTGAIKNRYFMECINRNREVLYAA
jgi:predicted nucleotidyltransferase